MTYKIYVMKYLVYLSAALLITSCATNKPKEEKESVVNNVDSNSSTSEVDESVTIERPVYHGSETVLTDLVHTKLQVNFNWEESRMNGEAFITAKPHFYATDSLILDAKGMLIHEVKMGDKALTHSYDGAFLRIHLSKFFTKDDQYTVYIKYTARPEERETGGSAAITSDKGLYFINPKGENANQMPQIWTQGETEASSVWFPTIDSPNAKTSQEILITVEDKFVTLSNGKMISSTKNNDGTRTDHWNQELKHAPYLFMMGVGEFKVIKDSYTRKDGSEMEVNYYVEPEWEEFADDIFGDTPEMIGHFSELLGVEYPWDKYNQIIVREYVSGAMENTSAVIFGDYAYKTDRELLDSDDNSTIAHELFHHWFGDLVTAESWSNLTINESFANYSQYLWDEHKYGKYHADYFADAEADGYFASGGAQGFHDLVWFDYHEKEQMFDGHSYNKGGRILNMLRNHIGDEAFFTALKNFLSENKFTAVEFHQLRLAFEKVTGEDLNWFFNQWYLSSFHPILEFTHAVDSIGENVVVTVEQQQDTEKYPVFRLPVMMHVYDNNGKSVYPVVIDKTEQTFTFPIEGELKGIVFDGQEMLLAKVNEHKTKEEYVHQYINSDKYKTKRDGILKGASKSAEGQKMILSALDEDFWHLRQLAISKISSLKDENLTLGINKLKTMALEDPKSSVRVAAIKKLSKKYKGEDFTDMLVNAIKQDSSYSVVATSLSILGKKDSKRALKLAKGLESSKSGKMAVGIAGLYSTYGDSSNYDYYEKTLMSGKVGGFNEIGMVNSFTMYLAKQDAKTQQKSIKVYKELNKAPGMYMAMFLPKNIEYLQNTCINKITTLKTRLAEEEEKDQAAYATKTRKEIEEFEALLVSIKTLL